MGQRASTARDSDVSESDGGPSSSSLPPRAPDAPIATPQAHSPSPTDADTGRNHSLTGLLSSKRPAIDQPKASTEERNSSVPLVDVVHDAIGSANDQEPSAHQLQSDDDDDLGFPRVASTDSFPSPPSNVKTDDSHPLTRRSSMSRTPGPPKLSRFRPSMDIVKPPSSPQSGYQSSSDSRSLDSSSSSSDEDLVGSGEELVSDWLDEPEDAVLSPPSLPKRSRHASGCSSVSSHTGNSVSFSAMHSSGGRNSNSSQHSMTGWASWLSSPDDVDEEEDADDEPVALTPFLRDNMPVYEVMKQVQLFRNLSQMQQEQVVRALKPAKFSDGEVIVAQGTRGSRFYMIAKGEAVVTKTVTTSSHSITGSTPSSGGQTQERMITHLRAGHYFGELALIYDDPRTATVRAVGDVELLYLTQEDFQHIGQVHLSLMLQQVPLLARLSARDQDIVLKCLRPANFNDGEYIVHQGEEGTRFYMITRGEAIVSEKAEGPNKKPYEKELTRLYEGHVFGEMSLIYSEPRTASVRAVGPVKCLYLSKEDFDKCLLSDHFQRFIQEAYVEKATRRAMRLRLQQRANSAATLASTPQASSGAESSSSSFTAPPPAPSPVKATETRKLVKQRLKNGQVVVNKYVIKGDLGRGTFGRVKLCESQEDGQMYAVKIMHKTFVQRMAGKEDQLYDVLRREVAIMKKLNHRNVVRLVEVIDDPNSQKMYLVQEYVQHSLMEEVTQARRLAEPIARKYMRDLLTGLQYLHFHKVIHRDIKPENILVSSDGVAKIADFGTARMIMNETETISGAKGTPAFMAPEMFNIDATYQGPAVDVWSLGATLYMMVIGHPPWMADNEILLAERVQRVELRFPKDVERTMEPHLKNLLQRMLTKDPALRISLKECFSHEWITKEGSDPLGLITPEKNLTVSMDESERAIENIPEQIDQRLTESLAQAHQMVKTRQESVGPGVVRTNSGRYFTGTPVSGTLGSRIPSSASTTSSVNTVGSSPSRASSEEVSRIICAWRHHKRVQLMDGHKDLSERSRELLIEQKRMAFSADRAKVTEIILPAAKPTGRSRYPSASSTTSLRQVRESSVLSSASSVSSMSTVGGDTPMADSPRSRSFPAGRSNSVDNSLLVKKNSFQSRMFKDSGNLEGFGRTSFTSVSQLSELATPVEDNLDQRGSLSSSSEAGSNGRSSSSLSNTESSDADLMKRSLSRKKDFLMVTSEVFRDEGGDYQTRKILFQARDDDFSVASRVPTHSNSGRELLPPGRAGSTNSSASSQKPRRLGSSGRLGSAGSGSAMGSAMGSALGSALGSGLGRTKESRKSLNGSVSSVSSSSRSESNVEEFDMDGIDCVQVTEIDDEDDDETVNHGMRKGSGASSRHFHHHSDSSRANSSHNHSRTSGMGLSDADSDSDDSDYSDVECDVDVDATFSELIASPDQLELISHDDEEIAPIVTHRSSLTSLTDFSDVDNSGKMLTLGSLHSMTSSTSTLDIVQVYVSSKIRENLTLSIRSGYAEAKGARSYMEDRTTGQTTCDLSRYPDALATNYASLAFFAVYDGHNGTDTAVKLQNELHHRFFAEGAGFVESPVTCISSVCEAIDNEILEKQNQSVMPKRKRTMAADELRRYLQAEANNSNLIEGECCEIDGEIVCGDEMKALLQPISFSGAASVFVVVTKQRKKRRRTNGDGDSEAEAEEAKEGEEEEDQPTLLYVANVGDCRAVLCTGDAQAVDLTTDHKASLPAEQARIEASGGFVHNGRLDGILQISRGFGDLAHKQDGHLVVTPDVVEHLVDPSDQFLLLASDGLFDVLTSQQAVNFVLRKLQTHGDVQLAAQELVLKTQAYFAHDNVSVVIVALNQKNDA